MTQERKNALIELRDKVSQNEGFSGHDGFWRKTLKAFSYKWQTLVHIENAYNGSLDAAMTLHEAMLPGWGWRTQDMGNPVAVLANGDDLIQERGSTPARAWLLAILEALIAQEPDQ